MVLGFIKETIQNNKSSQNWITKKNFFMKASRYNKNLLFYNHKSNNPIFRYFFYKNPLTIKFLKQTISMYKYSFNKNFTQKSVLISTHFFNDNFFRNQNEFYTTIVSLKGTVLPQNTFDLSYRNEWKTNFFDLKSKYNNGVNVLVMQKTNNIKSRQSNRIVKKTYFNNVNFYELIKKKNQHIKLSNLRHRKKKSLHKRLNNSILTIKKISLLNTKVFQSLNFLRHRVRFKLNKIKSRSKQFVKIKNLHKKQLNQRFKKNRIKITFKNHIQLKQLKSKKPLWPFNKNVKKKFVFFLRKFGFRSWFKQRLLPQMISKTNPNSFQLNSVLTTQSKKTRTKKLFKIKNNKLNNFFKHEFNLIRLRKKKQSVKSIFYTRDKKRKTQKIKVFSKTLNNYKSRFLKNKTLSLLLNSKRNRYNKITLNTIDKPNEFQKWEHSTPYAFTNCTDSFFLNQVSLLDNYINVNLQPHTIYKARQKKNQFYSFQKYNKPQHFSHFLKKHKLINIRTSLHRLKFNKFYDKPQFDYLSSRSSKIKLLYNTRTNFSIKRLSVFLRSYKQVQFKHRQFRKLKITNRTILNKISPKFNQLPKTIINNYKLNLFKYLSQSISKHKILKSKNIRTYLIITKKTKKTSQNKKNHLNLKVFKLSKVNKVSKKNLFLLFNFKSNRISTPSPLINSQIKNTPSIRTKTSQSFILKSPIMFFTQLFLKSNSQHNLTKFNFKKKIFSFLKPNEAKQALMDRKKYIFSYKLLFNQKITFQKNKIFSLSKLKQMYKSSLKINLSTTNNLFQNPLNIINLNYNTQSNLNDLISTDVFNLKGVDQLLQREEIKVPRVKFKPGYQRMWRQSRLALKESLRVKFLYQKQLSKYIVRFFRMSNHYAFSSSEMFIEKIIIYSRLLPDLLTLQVFMNQRLIYLNGSYITNTSLVANENDLIQLIVSKWYYSAYRWISNWTLKRVKKYNRLVYRKGLSGKYKLMKQKKQRSFYTPHWIYLTKYDISDIKPYLEVDYLTLSAIVIYNPFILNYNTPKEVTDYRPTIYRLYNWKYIT